MEGAAHGSQEYWFAAQEKGNSDTLGSEAASSKDHPFFSESRERPSLDSCRICFAHVLGVLSHVTVARVY